MMKRLLIAATLSCALLAVPATAEDTAPLATKTGTIAKPEAGKGTVIFYRPSSLMGVALGCTVHEGDADLTHLGSGKYYQIAVEPGKHAYFTEGEAKDVINLEIEPDETYFVKCKIGMGIMAGRANLSPSDQVEFAKKASGLSLGKGPKAE